MFSATGDGRRKASNDTGREHAQAQTRVHASLEIREPQDRYTLLAIAEKLKLAADTFRAVRSESQATQALALRDKALNMAALMDRFELRGEAA